MIEDDLESWLFAKRYRIAVGMIAGCAVALLVIGSVSFFR